MRHRHERLSVMHNILLPTKEKATRRYTDGLSIYISGISLSLNYQVNDMLASLQVTEQILKKSEFLKVFSEGLDQLKSAIVDDSRKSCIIRKAPD
jgi:hypothetical protein